MIRAESSSEVFKIGNFYLCFSDQPVSNIGSRLEKDSRRHPPTELQRISNVKRHLKVIQISPQIRPDDLFLTVKAFEVHPLCNEKKSQVESPIVLSGKRDVTLYADFIRQPHLRRPRKRTESQPRLDTEFNPL